MKRDLNIHIHFTNRAIYTFISFMTLLIIGVGVFALTPGVAPNPGHLIDNVAPPASCGTNQVLQWSGSSWTCANLTSSGSELWNQSGNNIYYNSGNVGIGTTAPTQKLDVAGTGKFNAIELGGVTKTNWRSEEHTSELQSH